MPVPPSEPVAVLMAAGRSTRMKSESPKVLHDLCGQPLLAYVLKACEEAGVGRKVAVVGFGADLIRQRFGETPGIEFVVQTEQKGTGHAVRCAAASLEGHTGPVIVIAGDQPMIRGDMIKRMLERFRATGAKAYLATAVVGNPFGMGRIIRDAQGWFERIVEQRDATPAEAEVREINPSFYVFDGPALFAALSEVKPHNAQGEYYLTDVPAIMKSWGETIVAEPIADEVDILGVNLRQHLAAAHSAMQERIQGALMDDGVTIVDPRNTVIDARATIGRDTIIYPFSVIGGPVTIGQGCRIGPFAHVREHTRLDDGVVVGAFVEVVRSTLGAGSIAKHLAYVGDAALGKEVNVGAGVITANYDGARKNTTTVDDAAFLGSGAVLVAPVHVGNNAIVGAGAVLTKNHDIQPGEMVVGVPARPMNQKRR